VHGNLYFAAYTRDTGRELWTSNGSAAGTVLVEDLTGDSSGSSPAHVHEVDGRVVIVADTNEYGWELWIEPLWGDYDRDEDVDGADFLLWQRQFSGTPLAPGNGADGDGSNGVGSEDLDIWMENFSESTGAPLATPAVSAMAITKVAATKGGVSLAARDWLFAAGDFSSLFYVDDDVSPAWRRRRR
jgi:ELWxxDGT repeat protein